MTFNDKEVTIAKTLIENPETVEFLKKVFCPDRSKIRTELEKNVAALTNEQYGEAMKVLYLTELHFASAMSEMQVASKMTPHGKPGAVAPK